jgi:transcriptional regulator with XRE-family HTH domain
METYGNEAGPFNVGHRLRELREERKVSMRSLARSSKLSANALSMIERGLTSPSVSTLSKLAAALEIPILAFFRQEQQREKLVFVKAGERTRFPIANGFIEGLGGERFLGRMEAFLLNLETGGNSGLQSMLHTGQEFVYCVQGILNYEVDGTTYVLNPGDSLVFTAQLPHRWNNPGPGVTVAMLIIASFDESERPTEFHMAALKEN